MEFTKIFAHQAVPLFLGEVGAGDIAVGYEQDVNTGSSDLLGLAGFLPGNGSGFDFGFLGSANSGTFGFYFGFGDYGFGGYISMGGGSNHDEDSETSQHEDDN